MEFIGLGPGAGAPPPGFESQRGHVRKLLVIWGRRWFSPDTLVSSISYNWLSHELAAILEKM